MRQADFVTSIKKVSVGFQNHSLEFPACYAVFEGRPRTSYGTVRPASSVFSGSSFWDTH